MLTAEQVVEYEAALAEHYGQRVAPVGEVCRAIGHWLQALKDRPPSGLNPPDDLDRIGNTLRNEGLAINLAIIKSSMLGRLIYGGEQLRTEPCPTHKGRWVGLPIGHVPECGCDYTGWLPPAPVHTGDKEEAGDA